MNLKICGVCLALFLALPLGAGELPEVGVVFTIDSPQVFPDKTLGESKSEIETRLAVLLAERLGFYFPFLDWTAGAGVQDRIEVKLADQPHGACGWQSSLVARAVRAGSSAEVTGLPEPVLYTLCDAFIPNRKDPDRDALRGDDFGALVGRIQHALENKDPRPDQAGGLLDNRLHRDAIHHELLSTIPMAETFELRDQTDGSGQLLYLPVSFNQLQSSDLSCEPPDGRCSRLRLKLSLPDSPPGSFTLRVAGTCDDRVLCEVLEGGVPGGVEISGSTWWQDELGNLLATAQNVSFTMETFTKAPRACLTLADTGHFDDL